MATFRVVYPQPAKDAAKALHGLARQRGIVADFFAALKTIDERLELDGRTYGEEIRAMPNTKQTLRHAVCYPLVVY
jgi:hypothetical protein